MAGNPQCVTGAPCERWDSGSHWLWHADFHRSAEATCVQQVYERGVDRCCSGQNSKLIP